MTKNIEDDANSGSLRRIANAIEEILQLVKADQERSKKYMEDNKSEQASRPTNGPGLPGPCAMAGGARTMLQGPGCKLQASSSKLDKIKLLCYKVL